ncbi:hypothetical protein Ddye_013124 [Dipteronia dyeriana]|uniref:DUF4283 domain-containing protein n=1 Tax=Dipteronia dyeriana TaxID=168575 RepID=A0AAD9X5N9_9ROSI|nr:hypothetical protein Ddye_013124 [Dipteronia dyeriana]
MALKHGRTAWLALGYCGKDCDPQKRHPRLNLSNSKILVWVKLFNIPYEYWNEEGLSHIASAVGKPLYADSLNESMNRISFSRVCIEIDASCDLFDSFDLFMGDSSNPKLGKNMEILVEYQCKQKICAECKSFGHSITNCPKLKPLLSLSKNISAPKLTQELRTINKRDAHMVCSPQACMKPSPFGSLKDDEVISTCNTENEPSLCPSNLPNHGQCQNLYMERDNDTSNKFATLVEDGDNRNDQCSDKSNDQCNDVDPPSMASLEHYNDQWLSSPTESSSKKKKKKQTVKKGKIKEGSLAKYVQVSMVILGLCLVISMSLGVWVSQLGAAPEFQVLWRSSMTVFKLRSFMIFVSRVFFILDATREAMVVSLRNWIEFLSTMIGLSSLRILKRFSFPLVFQIIVPLWLNLGCKVLRKNYLSKFSTF